MAEANIHGVGQEAGYDVLVLAGSDPVPRSMGLDLERITRGGVDGHEYAQVARRPQVFRVELFRDAQTASAARTQALYFQRMQGSLVNYRDEHGKLWSNLVALRVETRVEITPSGTGFIQPAGQSEYGVFAAFTLEATAIEPAE